MEIMLSLVSHREGIDSGDLVKLIICMLYKTEHPKNLIKFSNNVLWEMFTKLV